MWPFSKQSQLSGLYMSLLLPSNAGCHFLKIIPSFITKGKSFEKATGAKTFPAY